MKSNRFRSPAKWSATRKAAIAAASVKALPVGPINPVTGMPFTFIAPLTK